jgi:hypothetical protein
VKLWWDVFTRAFGPDSLTGMSGAHLLRMMRRQTSSTVHRRMNALLLLDDGWAAERVAEALFIDAETVRDHRRLYETSGVVQAAEMRPGQSRRRGAAAVHRKTLTPLIAAADSENPLYFVDATHPSCTAHPSHGWIRRGETRELKSNHGRVNITINGALRWHGLLDIHSHPSAEPFSVSWARIRWQRPTLLGRTRGAG